MCGHAECYMPPSSALGGWKTWSSRLRRSEGSENLARYITSHLNCCVGTSVLAAEIQCNDAYLKVSLSMRMMPAGSHGVLCQSVPSRASEEEARRNMVRGACQSPLGCLYCPFPLIGIMTRRKSRMLGPLMGWRRSTAGICLAHARYMLGTSWWYAGSRTSHYPIWPRGVCSAMGLSMRIFSSLR